MHKAIALLVLGAMLAIASPVLGQSYWEDFDAGTPGSEWSRQDTTTAPYGERFLGRFGNDTVTLGLSDLGPHDGLFIEFDLYIIDTWDGILTQHSGEDYWEFSADGDTLLYTTFSNQPEYPETDDDRVRQSYPDNYPNGNYPALTGAARVNTLGSFRSSRPDQPMDSTYRLHYRIPHTASDVQFNFAASNLGASIDDESWGLDNVRVVPYNAPVDPTPPSLPDDPVPDPMPEQKTLTVVTHGWRDQADGAWPQDLAVRMAAQVDTSEHVVDWYDWSDDADTLNPREASVNAVLQGTYLGNQIVDKGFSHVHLIAHSAGSWLIQSAAEIVKQKSPTTDIHLTFLDGYVPEPDLNAHKLGVQEGWTGTDWADNYYVHDLSDIADETSCDLAGAHNVDLTFAFPAFPTHSSPIWWYRDSVSDPSPLQGHDVYGFVRSLEASGSEGWTNNEDNYPLGNNARRIVWAVAGVQNWADSVFGTSDTGTVIQDADGLTLTTGSPVWATQLLEIPDDADGLSMSFEFMAGSQGTLAVYFGDELIFLGDSRVYGEDLVATDYLPIAGLIDPNGANLLSVRLDPLFEGASASVIVSNVEYGSAVPEPATMGLLALGGLAILRRRAG